MGEEGHNGTDGTPTWGGEWAEGWGQLAPPHRSRGPGVCVRGHHYSGRERLNFLEAQIMMVLMTTPY